MSVSIDTSAEAERIAWVLQDVEFRGRTFYVADGGEWLQVRWVAEDSVTGKTEVQHGRKWKLSPHMTRSELIQTAFMACLAAEEHEVREDFRYRGEAIFGPHFDVDDLHGLASSGRRDVRS